jgi:hypothetical protein
MFQYLITAVLLWALWASPLGKARKTGLVLLVLAVIFSLWTTVEFFATQKECTEASGKVQGNATSFKAKLLSLLGYRSASKPKAITKTGDFNTRVRSYTTVNNDLQGLPGRITANCATYTEKKLNDFVKNSDSDVSDITKYESKVAKAK